MKKKNILIRLLIILIGLLIVTDALGKSLGFLDVGGLPIIRIIVGAAMLAQTVKMIIGGRIPLIPIPLAIIFLLFEDEISYLIGKDGVARDILPTGTVIIAALLLSVGLGIIFSGTKLKKGGHADYHMSALADRTEYIDCGEPFDVQYKNRLGETDIRFANTDSYAGGGVVTIDNSLGEIDIYVPASWKLAVNIDNQLGEVEVPADVAVGPVLTVRGQNSLGEVCIRRV